MLKIDPNEIPLSDLHQYLVGAVAPRPIAFASTVDEQGIPNLAPYSFFNVFSSNPPILVFSSNRRVSNGTTKDTLQNVISTKEVVINVVSYSIVRQMSLTSAEFPPNVNEFTKSGLTPLPSDLVAPFRVAESPIHFECKVNDVIPFGEEGGAGHLIISQVLRIHIHPRILDEKNRIDPQKIDLMGRMGRAFYVRASGEAVHTIFQPTTPNAIGYDGLPESVLNSHILSANNLGQLAAFDQIPDDATLSALEKETFVQQILRSLNPLENLHKHLQKELEKENTAIAIQLAWLGERWGR